MDHNRVDTEKRWLTRRQWLALTGAGTAVGLAGCFGDDGNGGGGTQDPTKLPAVHGLTDYNNEAWQKQWEEELVPAFTKETDIDVEIEYSGLSGQQENRLATLIQSGDPPGFNTSTLDQVADLLAEGQLAEVSDVVEKVESVAGEIVSPPLVQDGDMWQVSHGYYTSVFHYRQDIYDALGLDVPTSFQELLDNAKAIDEADMDVRGYGLAGKKVGKAQDEFQVYLANMGVSPIGLRWKDPDAMEELEIHFPEDEVTTLLSYFQDLAQYSPDPTGIGWAESLRGWVGNQYAQMYNLNMWPAGIAGGAGVEAIAKNTGVAPLPRWKEGGITKDDVWLFNATADGHHVFKNAENTPGTKRFLEWVYGGEMSRTASLYEAEPTRFLPNYADVLSSDTFQSFDHWQQWPSHLEGLEKCQNEIVADYYGNVPEANFNSSAVALYVTRFFFPAEMVNMVVTGSSPKEAYDYGRDKLEQRFQEGKEKFGDA